MKHTEMKKWGGVLQYVSPRTEAIELQGGPCMDVASPNGGLDNLVVHDVITPEF